MICWRGFRWSGMGQAKHWGRELRNERARSRRPPVQTVDSIMRESTRPTGLRSTCPPLCRGSGSCPHPDPPDRPMHPSELPIQASGCRRFPRGTGGSGGPVSKLMTSFGAAPELSKDAASRSPLPVKRKASASSRSRPSVPISAAIVAVEIGGAVDPALDPGLGRPGRGLLQVRARRDPVRRPARRSPPSVESSSAMVIRDARASEPRGLELDIGFGDRGAVRDVQPGEAQADELFRRLADLELVRTRAGYARPPVLCSASSDLAATEAVVVPVSPERKPNTT